MVEDSRLGLGRVGAGWRRMHPHRAEAFRLCRMKGIIAALAGLLTLVGCASSGPTSFPVASDDYAKAFTAAKEEMQRLGFEFTRVDARGGVIATRAVSSAGFATPWNQSEASVGDEFASFVERDQRRVVVYFEIPDVDETVEESIEPIDVRAYQGELSCRVEATRELLHRPGFRLSTTAVRLSSVTRSPEDAAVEDPTIARSVGEDLDLSRKIARRIERRLEEPGHDG